MYTFDLENELAEGNKSTSKTYSGYSNAFVQFASKKTIIIQEKELFLFLIKWGLSLKITEKYMLSKELDGKNKTNSILN